jgi:hypothetical protein
VFLAPAGVLPPVWRRLRLVVSTAALLGSVASSLWCYPHSLSYFNELAGGPANGHRHMLGSAISWGQDLLYLKEWCDAHPQARPLYVAVQTVIEPRVLGIPCEAAIGQDSLAEGWYAIDANYLPATRSSNASRDGGRFKPALLKNLAPIGRIGDSLWIYRVEEKRPGALDDKGLVSVSQKGADR